MTNTRADELRTMIDALHEYAIAHGGYSVVCISAKIAEPLQAELDSLEYASVEPTPAPAITTAERDFVHRDIEAIRTAIDGGCELKIKAANSTYYCNRIGIKCLWKKYKSMSTSNPELATQIAAEIHAIASRPKVQVHVLRKRVAELQAERNICSVDHMKAEEVDAVIDGCIELHELLTNPLLYGVNLTANSHIPDGEAVVTDGKRKVTITDAPEPEPKRWPCGLHDWKQVGVEPSAYSDCENVQSVVYLFWKVKGRDRDGVHLTRERTAEIGYHLLDVAGVQWTYGIDYADGLRTVTIGMKMPNGTTQIVHTDQCPVERGHLQDGYCPRCDGEGKVDACLRANEAMATDAPEPSTPADLTTIAQPASKRFQDYMRTGVDKPSTRVDESSTAKPKCKTCGDNKTIYRMVGEHWKDVPCPDCQDKPDNEASFGLLHVDRDGDNLVFRSHDNDENVGTPCPHGAVHVNIAEDLARHICTIAKVNLHQPTIDLIVQRLHSAPERLSRNMSCTAFAILCQELRGVADDIAELEGK